jgi:hypothetical protein
VTRWKQARAAALEHWADIERSGYLSEMARVMVARHAAGERGAAKHVALEVLENVWFCTRSRPLANLAYRRTLAAGRRAIRDHMDGERPAALPRAA